MGAVTEWPAGEDSASAAGREGLALDAGTMCESFQRTCERHSESVALRTLGGSMEISWSEYSDRVARVAGGLCAAGVARGETVALMLANRPEAVIVDTAAMHLGAIPFSIYNTSSAEQVEYLLGHAECRVAVTESQHAELVLAVAERLPGLQLVCVVDDARPGARLLADLEADGRGAFDLRHSLRTVGAEDVATLIYTSGTTGPPKAVELTHRNLLWQARMLDAVLPLRPAGRLISYLPMAHLADRCASHYSSLLSGSSITFVSDLSQVLAALVEVHPTAWGAVPRVWEKMRAALQAGFAAEPDEQRRTAITEALRAAGAVVAAEQAGTAPAPELLRARERGEQEIFAGLRRQIGLDQVDYLISGAAPIAPEVLEFFAALGLPICELWGMSELSLVATVNPQDAIRIGTVGRALPGIELSLGGDGELLARGPTVMRGYRKDPERTAETIDAEGWLRSGDIATIDDDGYVTIVDRKKELIINAGGKNMSPANIENKLKATCSLIGSAVAIGDRRPYNTALIVLDPVAAASFAVARGIADTAPARLAEHPAVQAEVLGGVERANASLSRVEQIKRHTILPEEWQPGGDELTATMKLRRKPIAQKFAAQIEDMYARE
ncbi:MAG TPA: AMP-binding protein [Solirubrobacteraceae bacterium]|nr:AMP-binding protein [Solirubrobacteraceae bacterium]